MKNYLFFTFILLLNCTTTPVKYNLQGIEKEISGYYLNDSIINTKKMLFSDQSKTEIFYKSNNGIINEIDVYIDFKQDSTYQFLTNYYNLKFKTSSSDSTFNSWKTDSTEFLLYKISDSSILVNIFKRTYL